MAATGSNPGPCHSTGDRAPGVPSQINTIQTRAALPIHPAQAIRFSRCASRWTEPRDSWPTHRPDAIGIDRAKGDRPREAPAPGWEQTPRCRHGPAASIDGLADWPAASQSLAVNARIGCSFPSITGRFSTSWNSGGHRSPGGCRSGGIAGSGQARRNAPPTAPGEPAKARPEPPGSTGWSVDRSPRFGISLLSNGRPDVRLERPPLPHLDAFRSLSAGAMKNPGPLNGGPGSERKRASGLHAGDQTSFSRNPGAKPGRALRQRIGQKRPSPHRSHRMGRWLQTSERQTK